MLQLALSTARLNLVAHSVPRDGWLLRLMLDCVMFRVSLARTAIGLSLQPRSHHGTLGHAAQRSLVLLLYR